MKLAFPNEPHDYREARDRLLEAEIALRRQMEAVAVLRRELPKGGLVPADYVFDEIGEDGQPKKVKLSELFAPGKDSLIVYNMMFPRHRNDDRPKAPEGSTAALPREEGPCPSCVAFLDQLNGAAPHVTQQLNFVVVAKAPIERGAAFAKERGWTMRMLSSGDNGFKRAYGAEDDNGQQQPMTNVFHRDADGIRHFWSSEMLYAPTDPGQDPRHAGTLEPLWNLMDLTPEGRPSDWNEQLDYGCCH